jgi:RNA polymerase sigma-70 factor, ECF subfamily
MATSESDAFAAINGDDPGKLWGLLDGYRGRLRRMVALRIDSRLSGIVDPSDVIQDAYVTVAARLDSYRQNPRIPFFLWVRLVTGQTLIQAHRRHLGASMRDVRREVRIEDLGVPDASSAVLAQVLCNDQTSPSGVAIRDEEAARLHLALDQMKQVDREVLALRHFEQLSNGEAAIALGLSESAASLRYIRAAGRLRQLLDPAHARSN